MIWIFPLGPAVPSVCRSVGMLASKPSKISMFNLVYSNDLEVFHYISLAEVVKWAVESGEISLKIYIFTDNGFVMSRLLNID